jgi:hypothetical protein
LAEQPQRHGPVQFQWRHRPQAMETRRKALQEGRPFDPQDLALGEGISVSEKDYEMGGGGVDVLPYNVQEKVGDTHRSTQSVTHTQEGMRLRDIQVDQRAQEDSYTLD